MATAIATTMFKMMESLPEPLQERALYWRVAWWCTLEWGVFTNKWQTWCTRNN